MIPALSNPSPITQQYLDFLAELAHAGFQGEIHSDYANRTVLSTDNSIYQCLPQAVIYPRDKSDLVRVATLAGEERFRGIALSPRGGGTGTNGQSLTEGIMVDLSKHMNKIIEINAEERWVRVQTGVVKDQLSAALKPYGLFFAPELSTSNRATIGGMINTDASGQGSCAYGKTRDHVLELESVFLGGDRFVSRPAKGDEFHAASMGDGRVAHAHRLLAEISRDYGEEIVRRFPKLNRCLTGYDLAHIFTADGAFDLNSILCGSEGTLGFIVEAKLNVLPIPNCSALVNVSYTDFDASLRDAQALMATEPTSIETLDSKVVGLARADNSWYTVAEFFPEPSDPSVHVSGMNLVEFTADNERELQNKIDRMLDYLQQNPNPSRVTVTHAMGDSAVERIWNVRKKAVGLLGNAQGEARPIPFVEDTAVPPENLADYIAEFRALLDNAGLQYGMFGHVDAGVLHVRPAIDMKDPEQIKTVRAISDGVVALTQKYHGLIWGEHGKGVRSEYGPAFFGPLYQQLQRIKAVFDPHNQLNPGKIATPDANQALLAIDQVSTRGDHDRLIAKSAWSTYNEAVYCNGNGACFNWNPDDAMCPSWKGTRQRIHSPKGRAALVKEWLKQLSLSGIDVDQARDKARATPAVFNLYNRACNSIAKLAGHYDYNHEVLEAMQGCLGCKSCVGQCPIKIDVPSFRAKFFELYYSRYLRPSKHYAVTSLEFLLPRLKYIKPIYNALISNGLIATLLRKTVGMVDSPRISQTDLIRQAKREGFKIASGIELARFKRQPESNAIAVVQDAFTSHFDSEVVLDILRLLRKLGFAVYLAPYYPNGKAQHFYGFLKAFNRTAAKNADMLNNLHEAGFSLVGVDPAITMSYRDEYVHAGKEAHFNAPQVLMLQELLSQHLPRLTQHADEFSATSATLLGHCTEKTNAPASSKQWQDIFASLGATLQTRNVGCCGMAGTYGHDADHQETSRRIFEDSWARAIDTEELVIATGFSCRSQVKRFKGKQVLHPAQILMRMAK